MALPRITASLVAVVLAVPLGSLTGCRALTDASAAAPRGDAAAGSPGMTPKVAAQGVVHTGRGWTTAGIQGPVPAPSSCYYRHTRDGEVLPDPHCTPGAVDPAVTQANLEQTICRAGGYSDSVRPPEAMTEALKYKMLAAYGVPGSKIGEYELDHVVSVSLGGPSSTYNLWPEPDVDAGRYARSEYVANDKDEIEHKTWEAVCDYQAKLGRTQRTMATNWTKLAD